MKLIVFGATGRVGQELLGQALEQGHEVTAFTRDRRKIAIQHAALRIAEGNVLDPEAVGKAIAGQDVVLITLGDGRKGAVRYSGTKVIVDAMHRHDVNRLICQTTLGANESRDNLNFFWRYLMFGMLLKKALRDHDLQENYVTKSDLQWTIVRPGAFTDGPVTGSYKHGFAPDSKAIRLKISTADVAHFMLQQVGNDRYLRRAAGLSY